MHVRRMLGKVTVTLAEEDIIDKPIKLNVQKLRCATNCYVVFMIQFQSTDYKNCSGRVS